MKETLSDKNENDEGDAKITSNETKVKKVKGLKFDNYLAGGGLGFSFAMFLMMTLIWLFQEAKITVSLPLQLVISIVPNIVGGALASFLLLRKTRMNYLKDGVKIGLSGFIITLIFSMMLGEFVGGAYLLIGFIIGGFLGGLISKQKYIDEKT